MIWWLTRDCVCTDIYSLNHFNRWQAIVSASRHCSPHLSISASTIGVVFLGTPHRGSPAAAWGAIIASLMPSGLAPEDRLLKALEKHSDSLADRLRDFSGWLFSESVPVVCAFEQLVTDYSSRLPLLGTFVPSRTLVCVLFLVVAQRKI